MLKDKRIGIAVIGWIFIFGGAISSFTFLTFYRVLSTVALYNFFYGLIMFIIGIGIVKLKRWARIMAIIFITIIIIQVSVGTLYDISIIRESAASEMLYLVYIVGIVFNLIAIGLIYFLTCPSVKKQFKRKNGDGSDTF